MRKLAIRFVGNIDKNWPWAVFFMDNTRKFLKEDEYILHPIANFKTEKEAEEYVRKNI